MFRSEGGSEIIRTAAIGQRLTGTAGEVRARRQCYLVGTATELIVLTTSLATRAQSKGFTVFTATVCRFSAILATFTIGTCCWNREFKTASEFGVLAVVLRKPERIKLNTQWLY